jgi:hypothetical protein
MSLTSEEHKAGLRHFNQLLTKEAYRTELLPASAVVPYDVLLVRIESFEGEGRVWSLELSFLPGLEDELDDVSILQCFVALSDHISEEHRAALNMLIVKLNAKLPIGSFGLLDNPGMLFFKYNAMLPNDNAAASDRVVHELVHMTTYLISTFSEPLIRLTTI